MRGQVVGPVHGRSVVDVVRAGDDHHPDRGIGQPLELGRRALHGAPRLRVRVEQVAGDQQGVDLLLEGEVDGGTERDELALALGGGLVAQVGVAGAQVDVGRVEQAQHPRHCAAFGETCPGVGALRGALSGHGSGRRSRTRDLALAERQIGAYSRPADRFARRVPVAHVGGHHERLVPGVA